MANPDQIPALPLTLPAFYSAVLQQAQTLHDAYLPMSWLSRVSQPLVGGSYRWSPIVATLIAYLEVLTPPNTDGKSKPSDAFAHLSHEEIINLLNTIRHYTAKHLLMSAQNLDEAGLGYLGSSYLNENELIFFKQVFAYAHLVGQTLRLSPVQPDESALEIAYPLSASSTKFPLSTSSSTTPPTMPALPTVADLLNSLCERVLLGADFTEDDYHQYFIQAVHHSHHDALLLLAALFPPTITSLAVLATKPFSSDKPFSQHSIEYVNTCLSDNNISAGMKSTAREGLFMAWSSMIGTHAFMTWLGFMRRNHDSIDNKYSYSPVERRMLLNACLRNDRDLFNILLDVYKTLDLDAYKTLDGHIEFLLSTVIDSGKNWALAAILYKYEETFRESTLAFLGFLSSVDRGIRLALTKKRLDMAYQILPYLSHLSRNELLASMRISCSLARRKREGRSLLSASWGKRYSGLPLSAEQEVPYLTLVFSSIQLGIGGQFADNDLEVDDLPDNGVPIGYLISWQLKDLRDNDANTSYRLAVLLLMLVAVQRKYLSHAGVDSKRLNDTTYKNELYSSMYSYITDCIREDVPYLPLISACLMSTLKQMGNASAVNYNLEPNYYLMQRFRMPPRRYEAACFHGKDDPIFISLLTFLSAYLQEDSLSVAERTVISQALTLINRVKDIANLADFQTLITEGTADATPVPISSNLLPSSSTSELSLSDPCSSTSFVVPAQLPTQSGRPQGTPLQQHPQSSRDNGYTSDPITSTTSSFFSHRSLERVDPAPVPQSTVTASAPPTNGLTPEEQVVIDALPGCPTDPLPLPTAQPNEQRNPDPVLPLGF